MLVLGIQAVCPARAETVLWTNINGGNWNVAAHWEPNRVPASGDEVVITNNGTYTVTLNANASPARVTLGGVSGIQTLAIPGATLTLQTEGWVIGNGVLALSSGSLTGSGVLTVTNVMDWTGGTLSGGGATLIAPGATLNITASAVRMVTLSPVAVLGQPGKDAQGRFTLDIHGIASQWYGLEPTNNS